jgi:hypothetical protein
MTEVFNAILVLIMFIFVVCVQFSSDFIKFYVVLFFSIVSIAIVNILIKLRNK